MMEKEKKKHIKHANRGCKTDRINPLKKFVERKKKNHLTWRGNKAQLFYAMLPYFLKMLR